MESAVSKLNANDGKTDIDKEVEIIKQESKDKKTTNSNDGMDDNQNFKEVLNDKKCD